MAIARTLFAALVLGALLLRPALAQEGPNGMINPNRDCQTLLTCNFSKRGSYRGCVSSYSCRVCSFVPSSCKSSDGRRRVCRKLRCTWG